MKSFFKMKIKNKYTFFWLTGNREILEGTDAADALNKAGYGNGAVRALDFYAPDDNNDYVWNEKAHTWDKKPELITT